VNVTNGQKNVFTEIIKH